MLITSWDITYWCSINLLWKELMGRMSEHTGLISSYQPLTTAACTNTGGKMKGSHPRAADRCLLVPRQYFSQIIYFMQLGMLCESHAWFYSGVSVRKPSIRVKIGDFFVPFDLEISHMTLKAIGHLFYVASSFVHYFIAISEFKLELQSGNAQFGSKSMIFLSRVTLKFDRWH